MDRTDTAASDRLLTYREAAELLNVSERTCWTIVRNGELPSVRIAGRTVRICRHDIEAYISRMKNGGGQ